jgi:hypothetical protein
MGKAERPRTDNRDAGAKDRSGIVNHRARSATDRSDLIVLRKSTRHVRKDLSGGNAVRPEELV